MTVEINDLQAPFEDLFKAKSKVCSSLIAAGLVSDISDKWFIENLILSVNPAGLLGVISQNDQRFKKRDCFIAEIIRLWLLVGGSDLQLKEYTSIILSSQMPYASLKKDRSGQVTYSGLTLAEMERFSPEIARLSVLSGRTHNPGKRVVHAASVGVKKCRKEVSYVVMLLQALHCFIYQTGETSPSVISKDALVRAVDGLEAVEVGMISKKEKNSSLGDASRASRDTLLRAWDRYSEQAVILYALSSITEPNGKSFLQNTINSKKYGDHLIDYLPEIMARARYINDDIVSRLSSSADWHTSISTESSAKEKSLSTKINAKTINLIRALEVDSEPFAPQPVAQDIIDWLSHHYKI